MKEEEIFEVFRSLGITEFPEYNGAEEFARNLMAERTQGKQGACWSDSSGVTYETLASSANPGTCYA